MDFKQTLKKLKGKHYDYVYLTNTPSFYKVELLDALQRQGLKGLAVYYGYGSEAVNRKIGTTANSDSPATVFLNDGDSNTRSKRRTFFRLLHLMRAIHTSKVIYSGWLAPEYNLYSFISPRSKNIVVVESTPAESRTDGIRGFLKRRIVERMGRALPSGKPHVRLLHALGFKGEMATTGSVGIFPAEKQEKPRTASTDDRFRYLYVGRLIDCKNLRWLIGEFNRSGRYLTIVGAGILESELRGMAKSNISFSGFIENDRLPDIYRAHDIFVLPSRTEPWGLVVEEAISNGLPVIVSDRVGSAEDMVADLGTGEIFLLDESDDFEKKCRSIEKNYSKFAVAAQNVDFMARQRAQTDAFRRMITD